MALTIQCPYCETIYTAARCGLPEAANVTATIHCPVCQQPFDVITELQAKPAAGVIARLFGRTMSVLATRTAKREDV